MYLYDRIRINGVELIVLLDHGESSFPLHQTEVA